MFQQFHLLDRLDAMGNVEVPMNYAGEERSKRHAKAEAALRRVGLGERIITGRRNCPAASSSASRSPARS